MNLRLILVLVIASLFAGCATYAGFNYDALFGPQLVRDRTASVESEHANVFLNNVKPIIDNRCVVCHACYDAPCQLKLSSVEGIDRGATKALVYEGTRLTAAAPTRLFEDAETTQEWRDAGFHPVLNEREQSISANINAGLIARLLTQKERHPLPSQVQLEGFDFSINREQTCPTIEEYDQYEKDNPTWGMPFGMPNLTDSEYLTLMNWLENGAIMNVHTPITDHEQARIDRYEAFLNDDNLKNQLMARYIYEHLFLSHLYFADLNQKLKPRFFSLVRSSTPPGQPVRRISTRRPYDDPSTDRVYYRLIPEQGTIVDKTHMPYALNQQRFDNWKQWFIHPAYSVTELPSYKPEVAANPMTSFTDLPVKSRFKFMLDNAQNTIMAFIKGPVCRGQLALNVINDHFWVFFLDPDKTDIPALNEFYRSQAENLKLPSELESNTLPVTNWVMYARQQARYLEAKSDFANKRDKYVEYVSTDVIWDGYGVNPNAALTVFRHFDSASVVQGLVGDQPKTAWVMDYSLLERIHYLLVAGFDVYGNFGHQLITRMFMDFLRMEGESNFISLLPADMRHQLQSSWYQDQSPQLTDFLLRNVKPFNQPTNVVYTTDDPKHELLNILQKQLSLALLSRYEITETALSAKSEQQIKRIGRVKGEGLKTVPQITMLMVRSQSGEDELFTLLHNNAHTNISSLFDEESNRDYAEDYMTIVHGVLGSYPAAFFSLQEDQIRDFVDQFSSIQNEEDYVNLLDRFAIRRSSDEFWPFSDRLHHWYRTNQPIEFGLLDYNRFENR
ncbi:Fatty acid cis/trans isomerase (CTI) [Vibrio sp. B1FLJ16]|uniref:fatty acid cis/trans isomerase n=1 Tax=Vibrio sp. B1FLJ16 TaxID=2751178 RepID=UPI0015F7080B|nr:fatty acid cis/trans isomerase [Vibrio sp. B1FLJ16]CAD7821413.1 Fatty acid cis/trans isomerase (CTI) [Vibrio sp. B1FLJ16]CAE6946087.1 Fatty acid cis/trans isomerase (CTI) [Vibrio sp. B1FLJ16]